MMSEDSADTLQPGQLIRPVVTQDEAKALVEQLYGLKVVSIKELNSYDDRNFHVTVDGDSISNPHITQVSSHGYVFKMLNSMDSKKNHVSAEHEAMGLFAENNIPCSLPVINIHGNDKELHMIEKTDEDGSFGMSSHIVRLLTFVPGVIVGDVPMSTELLYSVGDTLGRASNALQFWSHGALECHKTVWSLDSLPDLRKFLYVVEDESRRKMVEDVIHSFEESVLANREDLRKGAIHGDFNEQNILCHAVEGTNNTSHEVCGVLDFGDMQYSCLIYDLAVCIMYMMVTTKTMPVLEAGGHTIAGYIKHRTIPDAEMNVLRVCIAGRFCQSLVMGAYSYTLDPGNEYLLVTQNAGWGCLQELWNISQEELYAKWDKIIDSYS